jgi:integrase
VTKQKTKVGRIFKKWNKRPDGTKVEHTTWTVRYQGKDYATGETDPAKAKAFLPKKIGEQAGVKKYGPTQPKSVAPVTDEILMNEIFDDLAAEARRCGIKTAIPNEGSVDKNLRPFFGSVPAGKLQTKHYTTFIDERLASGAARATVNRELALLKRALNIACDVEPYKIPRYPKIKMLKVSNTRKGFLSQNQYEKLKGCLPDYLVPLLITGYHVGNRLGELKQLELRDIEMDAKQPQFRLYGDATKSGEGRIVPILKGPMMEMFKSQMAACKKIGSTWLFQHKGKPILDFDKAWQNATLLAGLSVRGENGKVKGLIFHDLRRTAVRNLVRSGMTRKVAMSITGHKTESVFNRYDISDEKDLARAVGMYETFMNSLSAQQTI